MYHTPEDGEYEFSVGFVIKKSGVAGAQSLTSLKYATFGEAAAAPATRKRVAAVEAEALRYLSGAYAQMDLFNDDDDEAETAPALSGDGAAVPVDEDA